MKKEDKENRIVLQGITIGSKVSEKILGKQKKYGNKR